jgi:hypothetical protein
LHRRYQGVSVWLKIFLNWKKYCSGLPSVPEGSEHLQMFQSYGKTSERKGYEDIISHTDGQTCVLRRCECNQN